MDAMRYISFNGAVFYYHLFNKPIYIIHFRDIEANCDCSPQDEDFQPTHVVTSMYYGGNAHILFRKVYNIKFD